MGKIRKHYSLESSGAFYLDKSIIQRFEVIANWNVAHIYGDARNTFLDKYNIAKLTPGGWRQKILQLWPLIKHLNGHASVGKLAFKEWRVRGGISWQKSAWMTLSRKIRGKLPEKKKKLQFLRYTPLPPVPPVVRNRLEVNLRPRNAVPERAVPAPNNVEVFADQLRAYQDWLNPNQINALRGNLGLGNAQIPNNQGGVRDLGEREVVNHPPAPDVEIVAFDNDGDPIFQQVPRG